MNANRKKTGRALKKAVMATVIAGTLATSVAYPGLMGVPGVQVAMAEECEVTSGILTYTNVEGDANAVEITGFTRKDSAEGAVDVEIPEIVGGKKVTSVKIHGNNTIKTLDVTKCKALTKVDLTSASAITSINCSGCAELTNVIVEEDSELTALNVKETKVENVYKFGSSKLKESEIQRSNTIKIIYKSVERIDPENKLKYCIGINKNVEITGLAEGNTETQITVPGTIDGYPVGKVVLVKAGLTVLDISACADNLEFLECGDNQLSKLDVKGFKKLKQVHCNNNPIKTFDIADVKTLTYLDCENIGLEGTLDLRNFKDLSSLNCRFNNLEKLDVSNLEQLCSLYCERNQLKELNVKGCKQLSYVACQSNQLSSLDFSDSKELEKLHCENNVKLNTLDVKECTSLEWLECGGSNELTELEVHSSKLDVLHCSNGIIKTLDISSCSAIRTLSCSNNQIKNLDVSECKGLEDFACHNNQLSALDVSSCSKLWRLACDNNQLRSLDVSKCTGLKALYCNGNKFSRLDISKCTLLERIDCSGNSISNLDLSTCPSLVRLDCDDNRLFKLDIGKCLMLEELDCGGTNTFTKLNLQNHEKLKKLSICDAKGLKTVYAYGCPNLKDINKNGCDAEIISETYFDNIVEDEQPDLEDENTLNCPTQQEIKARLKTPGTTMAYKTTPDFHAPYAAGSLTDETLNQAIETLNNIRYIAGLPADVTLNDSYNELAQAAALTNYLNGKLDHTPDQPSGMNEDMFQMGYNGAIKSNLAMFTGKRNLSTMLINQWMNDGDASNIDRIGHRRWILNPGMKQTGFGCVWGDKGTYGAVYALDESREEDGKEYKGVAWPAKNMPISYFGTDFPWSYSAGQSVDESKAGVTLTRKRDGRTWKFQSGSKDFYVNNEGYGQPGCIIFRPDGVGSYQAGDEFTVNITGLDETVTYTVKFFSLTETGDNSGGGSGNGGGSGFGGGSGSGAGVVPVVTPAPTQTPAPEQKPAAETTPETNPTPANEPTQGSEEKKDNPKKDETVPQKEKGVTTEAKISGKTTIVTLESNKKKVEVPKVVTGKDGKKHKVTKLGAKAFAECGKVQQIVLPASIVSVDKKAFSGINTEEQVIILDASLTKKEVRKMEKKLRKAGFKGIIRQAGKKNVGKNTQDKKK